MLFFRKTILTKRTRRFVEGLLPEVSFKKNGLATINNVRFKISRTEKDIWFHLCSISNREKTSMLLCASPASNPDILYHLSFAAHTSTLSPYGAVQRLGIISDPALNFKIYSRKHDDMIDYYVHIVRDWVTLRGIFIYIQPNVKMILEEVPAPPTEGLTEIPVKEK